MSTAAIATGPYLRTANQCQISPEMTPPTTQIRQYHTSAAMKALVSELTTSATPWPTITSGALGAATAHRKPPAESTTLPVCLIFFIGRSPWRAPEEKIRHTGSVVL